MSYMKPELFGRLSAFLPPHVTVFPLPRVSKSGGLNLPEFKIESLPAAGIFHAFKSMISG